MFFMPLEEDKMPNGLFQVHSWSHSLHVVRKLSFCMRESHLNQNFKIEKGIGVHNLSEVICNSCCSDVLQMFLELLWCCGAVLCFNWTLRLPSSPSAVLITTRSSDICKLASLLVMSQSVKENTRQGRKDVQRGTPKFGKHNKRCI